LLPRGSLLLVKHTAIGEFSRKRVGEDFLPDTSERKIQTSSRGTKYFWRRFAS
jgi:hypothetical protein